MKTGESVICKSSYHPTGWVIGELRICPSCEKPSIHNPLGVTSSKSSRSEMSSCPEFNVIELELEEYSPDIKEDGDSICQFCNSVEE